MGSPDDSTSRATRDRVHRIAEEYLDRLHAGEAPSRDELLAEHPDIAAQLERRLHVLELLAGSSDRPMGRSPRPVEARSVFCASCGGRIQLDADRIDGIACPNCGESFSRSALSIPLADSPPIPSCVGRFEITGVLGRGAFGMVYEGRDPELGRRVAVKVPLPGRVDTAEAGERFVREARSSARLRHPNIVAVHETGRDAGVPFIVSDCIEGQTLAEAMATRRVGFRRSAELVREVALALDYAHQCGVIHRDIKPGNILMDSRGQPNVSDFGLARLGDEAVTMTLDGHILGTPAYMSPEQAAGKHDRVGPRSDVYSLGVVLYELLVGEPPFRGSHSMLLYQVLHEEPRAPRRLNENIPRDLETICLRAMEKEPGRRYASARALADDLGRYLRGEPVNARPVGAPTRLWRWSRRHPSTALLTAAVSVLLISIAVVSTVLTVRTRAARNQSMERLSRLLVGTGTRHLEDGDNFRGALWFARALEQDTQFEDRTEMHRLRLGSTLASSPRLTHVWMHDGFRHGAAWDATNERVVSWAYEQICIDSIDGATPSRELDLSARLVNVEVDGAGERIVAASEDDRVNVYRIAGGQTVCTVRHPGVRKVEFDAPGNRLVSLAADGTARVWNVASGEQTGQALHHDQAPVCAAFDRSGELLAVGGEAGGVFVWDLARRERALALADRHRAAVVHVVFSPDGELLATGSRDRSTCLLRVPTGELAIPVIRRRNGVIRNAFSEDGTRLLTTSHDGTTVVTPLVADASGQRAPPVVMRHGLGAPHAEFSPDGRRVVSVSYDGTVRVWSASTGELVAPPLHHAGGMVEAHFDSAGRRVLSVSYDGTVRVWDLSASARVFYAISRPERQGLGCFLGDGTRVAVGGDRRSIYLRDFATGEYGARLAHEARVRYFCADASREIIVSLDYENRVVVWDAELATRRNEFTIPQRATVLTIDSRGQWIASGHEDGSVHLFEAETGERVDPGMRLGGPVLDVEFSPDARTLAAACREEPVRLWNVADVQPLCEPLIHSSDGWRGARSVSFSPDGRLLASGGRDQAVRVCHVATGELAAGPFLHTSEVRSVAFSPDGRSVASTGMDGAARVWPLDDGAASTPFLRHEAPVWIGCFSRDGRAIATLGESDRLRLWDTRTGEPLAPPANLLGSGRSLSSHPRDLQFLVGSGHGASYAFRPISWGLPIEDALAYAELLSGHRIDSSLAVERLTPAEFESRWRDLSERRPDLFRVTEKHRLQWHASEAAACQIEGRLDLAATHVSSMIALRPQRPDLYWHRSNLREDMGDLEGARADVKRWRALGVERRARRVGSSQGSDSSAEGN